LMPGEWTKRYFQKEMRKQHLVDPFFPKPEEKSSFWKYVPTMDTLLKNTQIFLEKRSANPPLEYRPTEYSERQLVKMKADARNENEPRFPSRYPIYYPNTYRWRGRYIGTGEIERGNPNTDLTWDQKTRPESVNEKGIDTPDESFISGELFLMQDYLASIAFNSPGTAEKIFNFYTQHLRYLKSQEGKTEDQQVLLADVLKSNTQAKKKQEQQQQQPNNNIKKSKTVQ